MSLRKINQQSRDNPESYFGYQENKNGEAEEKKLNLNNNRYKVGHTYKKFKFDENKRLKISLQQQTDSQNQLLSPQFKCLTQKRGFQTKQTKQFLQDTDLPVNDPQQKFTRSKQKSTELKAKQKTYQMKDNLKFDTLYLLENCKYSIQTLQAQLLQKESIINELKREAQFMKTKLQQQNKSLKDQLKQAQRNIERNRQMIQVYMRQAHKSSNNKVNLLEQKHINNKKFQETTENELKLLNIEKILRSFQKQNNQLQEQNKDLKQKIFNLKTENSQLNQRVSKMGEGLGKAILTIKKNKAQFTDKDSSQKQSPILQQIYSESKVNQFNAYSDYGRIVTKKNTSRKIKQNRSFETPVKQNYFSYTISSQDKFSPEIYDSKMIKISETLKKTQQIDKIQELLDRMTQLARQDVSSNQQN